MPGRGRRWGRRRPTRGGSRVGRGRRRPRGAPPPSRPPSAPARWPAAAAAAAAAAADFSRFSKAVASVKGMPSRLIFPIGVHHIQRLLDLVGLTIAQWRDMLICVVGMIMCLRVNEVDQLQICDVLWYLDAAFHAKYQNTFACRLYKRKQDTARRGLYPKAGAAVADRLQAYTNHLGLAVSANCSKGRSPRARCRACMPVLCPSFRGWSTGR
jgi:hypothetical protein